MEMLSLHELSYLIDLFLLNDLTIFTVKMNKREKKKYSRHKKIACEHVKHLNATDATVRFQTRNARTQKCYCNIAAGSLSVVAVCALLSSNLNVHNVPYHAYICTHGLALAHTHAHCWRSCLDLIWRTNALGWQKHCVSM